jgi:hypothetical protein
MPFGWKKLKEKQPNSNQENMQSQLESILGADKLKQLNDLIANEKAIPPKVALVGKAGVGKTTTINNLFNVNYHISHTVAGTKAAQQEDFELTGGGLLTVIDMPGLGEDIDEKGYRQIYQSVLSQVDVILYIIQANARDSAVDQDIMQFIDSTTAEGQKRRIVIGLNQVDKIGPGNWNTKFNFPSQEQEKNIERRCSDIIVKLSKETGISHNSIVYYSALKRYRLYDLLIAVIKAAGDLGWKFPIQPADPFELADPEVIEFVNQERAKQSQSKNDSQFESLVFSRRVEDDTH